MAHIVAFLPLPRLAFLPISFRYHGSAANANAQSNLNPWILPLFSLLSTMSIPYFSLRASLRIISIIFLLVEKPIIRCGRGLKSSLTMLKSTNYMESAHLVPESVFYEINTQSGYIELEAIPDDLVRVKGVAPTHRWGLDILSLEGEARLCEVAAHIKTMCAQLWRTAKVSLNLRFTLR